MECKNFALSLRSFKLPLYPWIVSNKDYNLGAQCSRSNSELSLISKICILPTLWLKCIKIHWFLWQLPLLCCTMMDRSEMTGRNDKFRSNCRSRGNGIQLLAPVQKLLELRSYNSILGSGTQVCSTENFGCRIYKRYFLLIPTTLWMCRGAIKTVSVSVLPPKNCVWGTALLTWTFLFFRQTYNALTSAVKCSGHGTARGNDCDCERTYAGDRCQYKNDCVSPSDCNGVTCVTINGGTAWPKKQGDNYFNRR